MFFMFSEERDIKGSKITYLVLVLMELGYGILTEITLGG